MSVIEYREELSGIIPEMLSGFFVGWPNRPDTETFAKMLRLSHSVILAIDMEKGQVVGFINAISDGVLAAYIPLLEVLPEYKGKGNGKELARRMLKKLDEYYMVDLVCDRNLQEFYRRLGMVPHSAMILRNFSNQSGIRKGTAIER